MNKQYSDDLHSLSHTKWSCKYHIVFAPKYKYKHREFWCRGYYVDTVGKNTKRIKNHIANQLKEDQEREQLTLDLEDPFKKGKGRN